MFAIKIEKISNSNLDIILQQCPKNIKFLNKIKKNVVDKKPILCL